MFVNCTNHEILIEGNNIITAIPPSGYVARVNLSQEIRMIVDGVPIYKAIEPTEIKGLPDPADNTIYIVSAHVARCVNRLDIVCPNNAPDQCTRQYNGDIISVKSLLSLYKGDDGENSPDPGVE